MKICRKRGISCGRNSKKVKRNRNTERTRKEKRDADVRKKDSRNWWLSLRLNRSSLWRRLWRLKKLAVVRLIIYFLFSSVFFYIRQFYYVAFYLFYFVFFYYLYEAIYWCCFFIFVCHFFFGARVLILLLLFFFSFHFFYSFGLDSNYIAFCFFSFLSYFLFPPDLAKNCSLMHYNFIILCFMSIFFKFVVN